MERIPLYKYMDLVDPTNKLYQIEKKGKKEDIYSWKILIDELNENVIMNKNIKDFIEKINKNVSFSNIYYNTINIHIDNYIEKINNENSEYLFNLQKISLLTEINDLDFYLHQKDKIYKELDIINKISIKRKNSQINNNNLEKLMIKYMNVLEKRKNLISLINNKTLFYNYDDNLIKNINNEDDLQIAIDRLNKDKIIYRNVKLPRFIRIKEKNKLIMLFNIINKEYYFIYKYLKNKLNNKENMKPYNHTNLYKNIKLNKKVFINNIKFIIKMYIYVINLNFDLWIKNNKFNKYFHYFDLWRKLHIY